MHEHTHTHAHTHTHTPTKVHTGKEGGKPADGEGADKGAECARGRLQVVEMSAEEKSTRMAEMVEERMEELASLKRLLDRCVGGPGANICFLRPASIEAWVGGDVKGDVMSRLVLSGKAILYFCCCIQSHCPGQGDIPRPVIMPKYGL